MKMLGRDIDVRILGVDDVRAHEAHWTDKESEANFYYAEENPFTSLSTTELEERLKELDEQRQVLQAVQQLGTVQFDLTAEMPMLGAEALTAGIGGAREEESGVDPGSLPPQKSGIGMPPEVGQVHEFQRLAATSKLARNLSVEIEVEADINIPYGMIADLETYPEWMPWCTSGAVTKEVRREHRFITYDGQVGFGFETGSFLGTLGDTVGYRVDAVAPTPPPGKAEVVQTGVSEAEEATDTSEKGEVLPEGFGRVIADATNGFAYGDKLVYDWCFYTVRPGLTKVNLNMLFQAKSVLYIPLWDSMQNMVINKMLVAFKQRAEEMYQDKAKGHKHVQDQR
jgi:ribosome-associated toxin RatA of RatAB toxin-antitoxin module